MTETTTTETPAETTTETTEDATLTVAEIIRTTGEGASLRVKDEELDQEIGKTAEIIRAKMPQFRAALGGYNVLADAKLRLATMILTKTGHPFWNMNGAVFAAVWGRVWAEASSVMTTPPTKDEIESMEASIRQQVRRRRDQHIVDYIVRTVPGAADLDKASDKFKSLVRAEYESANLLAPKEWRKADDTTGSGPGGGPNRDDPTSAFDTATSGVAGLWNSETKTGTTPLLHASVIGVGVADLADRLADAGEIQDRTKVSDVLLAAGSVLALVIQRVEAPDTFGETEAEKLAETTKTLRKQVEKARKTA